MCSYQFYSLQTCKKKMTAIESLRKKSLEDIEWGKKKIKNKKRDFTRHIRAKEQLLYSHEHCRGSGGFCFYFSEFCLTQSRPFTFSSLTYYAIFLLIPICTSSNAIPHKRNLAVGSRL